MTNGELLLSDAPLNLMTFRNYADSVMTLIQLHNTAAVVLCQQLFAKISKKVWKSSVFKSYCSDSCTIHPCAKPLLSCGALSLFALNYGSSALFSCLYYAGRKREDEKPHGKETASPRDGTYTI